jgi:hypothetical protein
MRYSLFIELRQDEGSKLLGGCSVETPTVEAAEAALDVVVGSILPHDPRRGLRDFLLNPSTEIEDLKRRLYEQSAKIRHLEGALEDAESDRDEAQCEAGQLQELVTKLKDTCRICGEEP